MSTREKIERALELLGVKRSLTGFYFLKEAIFMIVDDPEGAVFNIKITKDIYPAVANKFKTKPARVERAMRHAIECSADNLKSSQFDSIFSNTLSKNKPTNSEFIIVVASKLDTILAM